MNSKRLSRLTTLLCVFAIAVVVGGIMPAAARSHMQTVPPPPEPGIANEACLACHGAPDQQITLPSGEILYLTVDAEVFNHSIHGAAGYACVQCHTTITEYPHPQIAAVTRRDVTLSLYPSCGRCHQDKYERTLDSVHENALLAGDENAAVCTDCHGAHNTRPPDQPRSLIPQTCERCHSQIYNIYRESVHGDALIGDGNPDVPSCTDCHGVHNISGPLDNPSFHLRSPEICAKCHTDPELMGKYGLTTNVLSTYLSDFHGTTVLFEAEVPGQETNKPVCVDCHGVHDIRKTDDPQSSVIKENLVITCKKCHPNANANFSAAWLSHYEPSPTVYPVVYFVDLFYKIFIPGVLGGMALFVVGDASRRLINRRKGGSHER